MTRYEGPIFDADNHLYETEDALTRYLPKQFEGFVKYVQVKGRTVHPHGGVAVQVTAGELVDDLAVLVAEHGGDTMLPRVGIMRTLYPDEQRCAGTNVHFGYIVRRAGAFWLTAKGATMAQEADADMVRMNFFWFWVSILSRRTLCSGRPAFARRSQLASSRHRDAGQCR